MAYQTEALSFGRGPLAFSGGLAPLLGPGITLAALVAAGTAYRALRRR